MALFTQPVYINLPTTDVERIRAFWTAIGAAVDEEFSDEDAVCVELTESTHALYLSPGNYTDYIGDREIADCVTTNAVLLQLTAPDRASVDELVARAVDAGGAEVPLPADLEQDMAASGVYTRQMTDPDGHQWEFMAA